MFATTQTLSHITYFFHGKFAHRFFLMSGEFSAFQTFNWSTVPAVSSLRSKSIQVLLPLPRPFAAAHSCLVRMSDYSVITLDSI